MYTPFPSEQLPSSQEPHHPHHAFSSSRAYIRAQRYPQYNDPIFILLYHLHKEIPADFPPSSTSCSPQPPNVSKTIRVQVSYTLHSFLVKYSYIHHINKSKRRLAEDSCPFITIASYTCAHEHVAVTPANLRWSQQHRNHSPTSTIWAVPVRPQLCTVTMTPLPISDAFPLIVV